MNILGIDCKLVALHDSKLESMTVRFIERISSIAIKAVYLYELVSEIKYNIYSCDLNIIVKGWKKVFIDYQFESYDSIYDCSAKIDGIEIPLFLNIMQCNSLSLLEFSMDRGGIISFEGACQIECEFMNIQEYNVWEGSLFSS